MGPEEGAGQRVHRARRIGIVAGLLLAWLAAPVRASPAPQDDFQRREGVLREALHRSPRSSGVFERWRQLWLDERDAEAWLECARAEVRDPRASSAWIATRVAVALDLRDEAEDFLEILLERDGEQAPAWILAAQLADRWGRPERALPARRAALERDPPVEELAPLARELALALVRQPRPEEAGALLRRLHRAHPRERRLHAELAEIAEEAGQPDLALELWSSLCRDEVGADLRHEAEMQRGRLWLASGRHAPLRAALAAALDQVEPQDWRAQRLRDLLEASHRRTDEEAPWLEWLRRRAEGEGNAAASRAWIDAVARLRGPAEADAALDRALVQFPAELALRELAIEQREQQGRWREAHEQAVIAARLDPRAARWRRAAEVALRAPDQPDLREAALQHCRRSIEDDERAEVADAACRLLLDAAGRRAAALDDEAAARLGAAAEEMAREALRRQPMDGSPLLAVAELRARRGDRDGAVEWARRSLEPPRGDAEDHRAVLRFLTRIEALEPAAAVAAAGLALRPGLDATADLIDWCIDHQRAALARPWLDHLVQRSLAEDRPSRCVEPLLRAGRELGSLEQWARDWRRRAQDDPSDLVAPWMLAALDRRAGAIDAAVSRYEGLLQSRPDDLALMEAMLEAVAAGPHPERASALLRRWAERSPLRRPQYWERAIAVELEAGAAAAALELARRLAAERPDDAGALALLAEACFAAAQPGEGLRALRRCVHRDPEDLGRRAELARRLQETAPDRPLLWAEADEHWFELLLRASDAGRRREAVQQLRAIAAVRDRPDDLVARLRGARDRLGDSAELVAAIARVQREQGRAEEAAATLDAALPRHPRDATLIALRLELADQQEDWTRAARLQTLLLELGAAEPDWARIVERYERAGQQDEAQWRWRRLLDAEGGPARAGTAVDDWVARGEVERARRWAIAASERRPDERRLLMQAAVLQLAAGETDPARARFLALARGTAGGPIPTLGSAPAPGLGVEPLASVRVETFAVTGTAVITARPLPVSVAGTRVRQATGSTPPRAPSSWTTPDGERPLGGRPPWPLLPELWPHRGAGSLARQLRELPARIRSEAGGPDQAAAELASVLESLRDLPPQDLATLAALVCFQPPLIGSSLRPLEDLATEWADDPRRLLPFAHAALEAKAWALLALYCSVLDREPRLRPRSAGLRLRCLDGLAEARAGGPADFVDAVARDLGSLQQRHPAHASNLRGAALTRVAASSDRDLLRRMLELSLDVDPSAGAAIEALWWAREIDDPDWTRSVVRRLADAAPAAPRRPRFLIAMQLLVHGEAAGAAAAEEVFLQALAAPAEGPEPAGRLIVVEDRDMLILPEFRFPPARPELPDEALLYLYQRCARADPQAADPLRDRLTAQHCAAGPVTLALARLALRWFRGEEDAALAEFERVWVGRADRLDLALLTARGAVLAIDPERAARALQALDPDSAAATEARELFDWMRGALFAGPPESVLEAVGLELRFTRPEPVLDPLFPHWSQFRRPRTGPLALVRAMHDRPRGIAVADRIAEGRARHPDHHDLAMLDLLFRDARGRGDLETEARAWFQRWTQRPAGYGSPLYADLVEALLTHDPGSAVAVELAERLATRTDSEEDLARLFTLRAAGATEDAMSALIEQTLGHLDRRPRFEPLPEGWRRLHQTQWLADRALRLEPAARRCLLPLLLESSARAHRILALWTPQAFELLGLASQEHEALEPEARRRILRALHELLFVEGPDAAPPVAEDRIDPRDRFDGFVEGVLELAEGEAVLETWRDRWSRHARAADAEMLRLRQGAARRRGESQEAQRLGAQLAQAEAWRDDGDKGRGMLSVGRPTDAAASYAEALPRCQDSAARSRVLLGLGTARLHAHDLEDGPELLEAAARADPRRSAEVAWALLSAPASRRDLEAAGRHLQWALEHEAQRPRTLRAAALFFVRTGASSRALRALQRLDELRILEDPPLAERLLRALVQLELGQRREAERDEPLLRERIGAGDDLRWRELAREWIARVDED